MPPASRPRSIARCKCAWPGRRQAVPLIALFQHPEIRIVHGLTDAIRHIGGVDIAPQIQIDVSTVSCRAVVLKGRFCSGAGIDHILQRRILIFGRSAPDAGDNGDTDVSERFLYLSHPPSPPLALRFACARVSCASCCAALAHSGFALLIRLLPSQWTLSGRDTSF